MSFDRRWRGGRPKAGNDNRWTDREMWDFASALQRYGSGETERIALAVKTKSENAVKLLLGRESQKARLLLFDKTGTALRKGNFQSRRPKRGQAEGWPAMRKWQKIAQNQMMSCVRKVDYSCLVLPSICDRFVREAEPPSDPQLLDVRAVYAYMGACMRGRVPPELPPKESAVVLMLLRLMREMRQEMDTHEETHFIRNFKKATKFVPFELKDEFKKKMKQAPCPAPSDAVPIPEEVYSDLSRHRKVVQSFNPLTVPLWVLAREQEFLARMFDACTTVK